MIDINHNKQVYDLTESYTALKKEHDFYLKTMSFILVVLLTTIILLMVKVADAGTIYENKALNTVTFSVTCVTLKNDTILCISTRPDLLTGARFGTLNDGIGSGSGVLTKD
jgi:hypothetical protein